MTVTPIRPTGADPDVVNGARVLPVALNPDDEPAMLDRPAIARRIRRLREARGWSQFDLGVACGCPQWQISRWERGIYAPELTAACRLADALETTLDRLIRGRR